MGKQKHNVQKPSLISGYSLPCPVMISWLYHIIILLSNSENHEHLKNFRNVDCVLANHNKVQDTQVNLKTTNLLPLLFAV